MKSKKFHLRDKHKTHLRQLYNHANVLHNLAWEARFALEKEVDQLTLQCQTKEDWQQLRQQLTMILHCQSWQSPQNPPPKRSYSHSGNIEIFGFYSFQHACEKDWM